MGSVEDQEPPDGMTIDEIARVAGLTARNVRAYQEKGLLHPPTRVGRAGVYDGTHVERLEIIARLLDRGFSLAAISSLLESWQHGQNLADVLGLEQALATSWQAEPVQEITLEELMARLPGSARALEGAVEAQIIDEPAEDGTVVVNSPRSLELADVLHELGMPVDVLAAEAVQLRRDTDRIADRLVAHFVEHMWRPYVATGRSSEAYDRLLVAIEAIRTMPADMVTTTLAHSLRVRLDGLASAAGGPGAPQDDGDRFRPESSGAGPDDEVDTPAEW